MKAAPKAIPSILLCWPTTSEADVSGMAGSEVVVHFSSSNSGSPPLGQTFICTAYRLFFINGKNA